MTQPLMTEIHCDQCGHTLTIMLKADDDLIRSAAANDPATLERLAQIKADYLATHQIDPDQCKPDDPTEGDSGLLDAIRRMRDEGLL